MNYLILGAISALSLFAGAVSADSKAVEAALKQELPSIKPDSITESPIKGLYEVVVGARLFYVSEDGKFLVHGSVMDLKTREDLSDRRLASIRLKALEKVGLDIAVNCTRRSKITFVRGLKCATSSSRAQAKIVTPITRR